MSTRTARTLGVALLTVAGVAAPDNFAPAQVGGFTPTNPAFRTYLPPRQPGANPAARTPSSGTVQVGPTVSSGGTSALAGTPQPPTNFGFVPFEPPAEPPVAGQFPAAPSGPGFQFNPGWGILPAGGFGQPLAPPEFPQVPKPKRHETALKPTGKMVVERDGSRFYRVAGSELFYSPASHTYLNPQTGVVSRPAVMW
jgi:hypothetical protein